LSDVSRIEIPLSSPCVEHEDRHVVNEVLNGRTLSIGPWVERFEHLLSRTSDRAHAVAVSSGTAALHLIVRALGWGDGDEVITTPFSFVASANCLLYERARPVFVDIDPVTRCIDTTAIERAITSRTVGILSVDVFGYPADWAALEKIAARRSLMLVSDSCESLGTMHSQDGISIPAGKTGIAGAFAFYPNKQITTGEGGAVVTDDERIARLCRSMRNQGRDEGAGWLQHARLGFNYRLSEINSALGYAQLNRLDEIKQRRNAVAARYLDLLEPLKEWVEPPPTNPSVDTSWFVFVVCLREQFSPEDRNEILADLRSQGIGCSNYFSPIHLQPYIREHLGTNRGDFPVTERIADRTIALPFYTALSAVDQEVVVRELAAQLQRAATTTRPGAR
jgi:dTDP-4-amino-4,6-dideoxygalactose transaminase